MSQRTRFQQGYCAVCHQRTYEPEGCARRHSRAEVIVYRLRELYAQLKYADADAPSDEDRTALREWATLMTEWWTLPNSEIGRAAALSPTANTGLTYRGAAKVPEASVPSYTPARLTAALRRKGAEGFTYRLFPREAP